jgi:hypothetical protein
LVVLEKGQSFGVVKRPPEISRHEEGSSTGQGGEKAVRVVEIRLDYLDACGNPS